MERPQFQKQVELAQAGDKKALEIVCRELQGEIKSTFSRLVKNPDLVEDLCQETYIRLIKDIQNIKDPIKIKNFVAKIALHVLNDYLRKHYKWKEIILTGQNFEENIAKKNLRIKEVSDEDFFDKMTIEEVVHIIPGKIDKHLIQLKLEGRNYKEISHELEISEGAAKMRYKRTVEFLKAQFKD